MILRSFGGNFMHCENKTVAFHAARRTFVVNVAKASRCAAILLALGAALLTGACGTARTGATLDGLNKKVGGPGSKARIVIVRGKDLLMLDNGWQVYLDGAVMGDLKTGTFVYRDVQPGSHKLMFSLPGDFARASTQNVSVGPGRTYVYRIDSNTKGKAVMASAVAAGLAGYLISSAIAHSADERGFYEFILLEGEERTSALADIRLSD